MPRTELFINIPPNELKQEAAEMMNRMTVKWIAACIVGAAALNAYGENASRATGEITGTVDGVATTRSTTLTLRPSDGVGVVCGKLLRLAGQSVTNYRTFNCDGTGTYVDDSPPPNNRGTFVWGYAVNRDDASKLYISTIKDLGNWGDSTGKAVGVYWKFTSGNAAEDTSLYGAHMGIMDNGKVLLTSSYGYISD
jgi:hypothetical protein